MLRNVPFCAALCFIVLVTAPATSESRYEVRAVFGSEFAVEASGNANCISMERELTEVSKLCFKHPHDDPEISINPEISIIWGDPAKDSYWQFCKMQHQIIIGFIQRCKYTCAARRRAMGRRGRVARLGFVRWSFNTEYKTSRERFSVDMECDGWPVAP